MTSSNAPAAGGRIDSDDRGGPERGLSPPLPPTAPPPPPPPQPQASLPPASAPSQLLRAISADPAPTSIALAQATNVTLDAPPTQPSGSPNANPAASSAPRTKFALGTSATPADGQNTSADRSNHHDSTIQPSAADSQMPEPVDNTASQPPPLPLLDTTMYALNLASNAGADNDYYDQPMLSPPTVSPLSTPAVTHVNIDDDKDMDSFMLAGPSNTTDPGTGRRGLQEAASIVSNAAGGFTHSQSLDTRADPTAMDLDEPQLPETSQYHAQLIRQHGLSTAGNRRSGLGSMPRGLEHMQSIATTDPEPDSTQRYESGRSNAIGNVDPNVLMMALANASGAQFDHLPNAVAPSEISLHDHTSLTQEDIDPTTSSASARTSQNLESFARIEFEDSVFQMTTYAVIIGRDQKAINQARKDERRMEGYRRRVDDAMRNGLPPPTPIAFDRGKFSKSYVSEEGGMLGPESDGEDNAKGNKKRRVGSIHASVNGDEGNDADPADRVKSNRQYVSHTPGAAAVDVGTLQPSTAHIPFIGIHSPGPDIAKKTKGISRQHLKIQFNEALGVFQAIALHRNGFFVGDVICKDEHPVTVRSGEKLQIKDVSFRFIINGVEEGKTGGEELDEETSSKRMSIGGKEMSFDFEHSENDKYQDSSEDLSPLAETARSPSPASSSAASPVASRVPPPAPAPAPVAVPITQAPIPEPAPRMPSPAALLMPDPMHHGLSMEELALSQLQEAVSRASPSDPEPPPPPPPPLPMPQVPDPVEQPMVPMEDMRMIDASTLGLGDEFPPEFLMQIPKRRGPGRPPKDGIMSKRERRLLKKQLQENSRKTLPQEPQGEKIKRPVGRPRKNPLPEDGDRIEKRKYNKRKSIEDGDIGSDAERRAREKKDKKVRPKSPPLQLNREDFTEEQLAKPSKNYGVLIDEALNHGPPEGLTLKQIYKRITQRYPWFYFHAETKGWESSVRHNLIGNEAFKKAETTGLWSRVPGVELDAGKKRKAVSPDRHMGGPHGHLAHMAQHQYYQGGPYVTQPMAYGHAMPNAYTGNAQAQGSGQPLQTALPGTPAQQQNLGQPGYPSQTPAPAQLPPGYGASTVNNRSPATGPQNTYSSPYARPPPPPPAQGAPVKNESNAPIASQNLPSTLQQGIPPAAPLKPPQQTQAVAAHQPHNQPPRPTQPAPASATSISRPYLTPEMEKAIAQFRTNVMADLSKHTKNAGQIIDAAIGRVRGLSTPATVPGFEEVERTLVNGLQMMISKMQKVEIRGATPTSASPAPAHLHAQKQPPLPQPPRPAQPLSQATPSTHTASPAVTAPVAQQVLQPAQTTPIPVATRQTPVQYSQPSQTMPQALQQNSGQAQIPKPIQLPQVQPTQAQPPAQHIAAAHVHSQTPAVPQVQASATVQAPSRPQPPMQTTAQSQSMPQQRTQTPQQPRAQPAQQPTPVKTTPTPMQISTPGVGPASAAVSACDAEIQRRIKSFRESIIGTLKAKTNQAEAIVDSAIRRAQGLSNPGAFKGWEQADRLMYESVTKIINDVRKRQDLAAQAASGTASARSSQTPAPAASLQKAPSASPAPGAPGMPSPAGHSNNQPKLSHSQGQQSAASPSASSVTTPSMKAATPYVPRPGISVARPVSTQVQRPSPSTAASPPVVRKESVSAASGAPVPSFVTGSQSAQNPGPAVVTAMGSAQPPPAQKSTMSVTPAATPAIKQSFAQSASSGSPAVKATVFKHNFTGAANPSAGVMDQIAAHKPRPNNPGLGSVAVPQQRPAAGSSSVPHALSSTTGKPPITAPNFSSAARPSAGVVSQITGHQQRHAPDSAMAKFPSSAPPSAGVLDQITSQHQKLANQQAAKPASPAPPLAKTPASGIAPLVGQLSSPQPVVSKPIAGLQNVASTAITNAANAQPVMAPVTAQRLEAAQPAGPQAPSPQVAPPRPAPSQSPASRPPGPQPLTPQAPAVTTPPSQGPVTQPQAAQMPAAQVPAARALVTQGLAAPSSSIQKPVSSVQAAHGLAVKSELSQSPAAQGLIPQGLKAQTVQHSPAPHLPAAKPPVSQPGTQMAVSRASVPPPTLTTTGAVKSVDGSTASQPPGVHQLAGQKRPLEPEANKNNGEEPQLKKVAISAE